MSILIGTVIGFILGLTGAGGSILAVPLLMAGLDWPITQAATVSLLAVAVAAAVGALMAWRHSYVRYRTATFIAVIGVMVAPFGIRVANTLQPSMLIIIFSIVLGIVAIRMFRSAVIASKEATIVRATVDGEGEPCSGKICKLNPLSGRLIWNWGTLCLLGLVGTATGFLSGLLGVGGGFVIVPALRATTPLSIHSAIATSLMAIALISTGTVVSGLMEGRSLPLEVALPFVAGTVSGMALGRVAAPYIADHKLQKGFSLLVLAVSMSMMVHALARF
ncbi:sulfite exporter TauE/SafE family protein [Georgfuchsia toluolica]|uniref:sulfite exporter TauE/SafE family protein n=1 Tax=Georgfuchsia toluolica TaxID=424218 RepID=UPI001C7355B6|nr:sulfite exporter TauE/SafE family protein [Georgfuchsia toluolica]